MPFDAAIISRDFTGIYDNALVLGGASLLRTLTYGSGWSRIRLGALVAVTPNGTSNISDTLFTIGLCSGKDYPGSSNIPQSAFGVSIIGSNTVAATRLLTYTANSSYPYFSATAGVVYRRQNAVNTVSAGLSITAFLPLAYTGIQKRRLPIVIDITRNIGGSGLATVTVYAVTVAATAQIDFRPDDLQSALDQLGTPTVRGVAMTAATAISTITISDDAGPLDTFELYYSNTTFPLEVYAVGAVVINPTNNSATNLAYTDGGGGIDNFTQYVPGVELFDFNSYGTGFTGAGTVYGSSWGTCVMGLQGTSGGVPCDTFEQYTTGSVTTNVTLNAGTGWVGNGLIY